MIAALPSLLLRWSRRVDGAVNRGLERAHPPLRRAARSAGAGFDAGVVWLRARLRWVGRRLRPVLAVLLRGLALFDRRVRSGLAAAVRAASAASAVATPRRAVAGAIAIAGALLVVSQFVDYHAVKIGQPGYAELPDIARAPTVDSRAAGEAHAYVLVPVGLAAIGLAAVCARSERRRWGLAVAALGLIGVAVALAVDLPQGLDAGAQGSRFAGVEAVLENGFYAELAAAAMLVVSGLVYYARPCLIRISLSGRAASARRRRPRRRASSRARAARSA